MDPYALLLEELWDITFDKLEDPKDKLNLLATNSQFENPFLQNKSEWQFHAVLPILFGFSTEEYFHFKDNNSNFNLKEAFLNCRLISSRSCKIIDKVVQNYWEKFNLPLPLFDNDAFTFRSKAKVNKFFNHFDINSHKRNNPFLSRSLSLSCSDMTPNHEEQNELPSLEDAIKLVENKGKFLYSFTMFIRAYGIRDPYPSIVFKMLSSLPNVTTVDIAFFDFSQNIDEGINPRALVSPGISFEMLNFSNLKDLCICGDAIPFPGSSIHFTKSSFLQLTFLQLHFSFWRNEYNVEGIFPKLRHLTLSGIEINDKSKSLLSELFCSLDSPHLEGMSFVFWISDPNREEKISTVADLQKSAVESMKKRFPNSACDSKIDMWEINTNRMHFWIRI